MPRQCFALRIDAALNTAQDDSVSGAFDAPIFLVVTTVTTCTHYTVVVVMCKTPHNASSLPPKAGSSNTLRLLDWIVRQRDSAGVDYGLGLVHDVTVEQWERAETRLIVTRNPVSDRSAIWQRALTLARRSTV